MTVTGGSKVHLSSTTATAWLMRGIQLLMSLRVRQTGRRGQHGSSSRCRGIVGRVELGLGSCCSCSSPVTVELLLRWIECSRPLCHGCARARCSTRPGVVVIARCLWPAAKGRDLELGLDALEHAHAASGTTGVGVGVQRGGRCWGSSAVPRIAARVTTRV